MSRNVEEKVVVELKSVRTLVPKHAAQTINDFNATGMQGDDLSISANRFSNSNALPKAIRMSRTTSQPSPEKILCILCIDVNQKSTHA